MSRWLWLICLLLAWVGPVRAADDPFEENSLPAPAAMPTVGTAEKQSSGYVIPSAGQLGSSEEIINYRKQFAPTLYQTEWAGWPWLDLGMLAALLLLGCVMVWRRVHFRWFWIPTALTLGYFGVARGGCICPVGSVANLAIGIAHPERVAVFTALMFLLPLVVALVMGRVFCVAGCPLGAMQHLLGSRRAIRLPVIVERVLRGFPVVVLTATAWLAVRGGCMLACLLDPYKTAFFWSYGWLHRIINWCQGELVEPGRFWVGNWTAWGILLAAIVAGFWVCRPFCRFVCPYGVLLGIFSVIGFKRRRIDQTHCVLCGVCEKRCPVNAITRDPVSNQFAISSFHCIQCNRCSSHCRKDGIC